MTSDFMEFIKWIFASGWAVLSGIKVPGFSNVTFADLFIAIVITGIAFMLLGFYGLARSSEGSSGGNSKKKAKEEE